jgi:hypothetical protein
VRAIARNGRLAPAAPPSARVPTCLRACLLSHASIAALERPCLGRPRQLDLALLRPPRPPPSAHSLRTAAAAAAAAALCLLGSAGFGPSYAVGCAGRQQHGPSSTELIVGGSEDGRVHMWGLDGGECLSRLEGHTGTVFHTTWNRQRSLLASCSDDGSACTWWYDANLRARPQAAAAGPR